MPLLQQVSNLPSFRELYETSLFFLWHLSKEWISASVLHYRLVIASDETLSSQRSSTGHYTGHCLLESRSSDPPPQHLFPGSCFQQECGVLWGFFKVFNLLPPFNRTTIRNVDMFYCLSDRLSISFFSNSSVCQSRPPSGVWEMAS